MFDNEKFIREQLRNPEYVEGLIASYGFNTPPRDTIRKWFSRQNVPPQWLVLLLAIFEIENGEPLKLSQYMTRSG